MRAQGSLALSLATSHTREALTLLDQSAAICQARMKVIHVDPDSLTETSYANMLNQDKDHVIFLTIDFEAIASIEKYRAIGIDRAVDRQIVHADCSADL